MHKSAISWRLGGGVGDEPESPFLPYSHGTSFPSLKSSGVRVGSGPG